MSQGTTVTVGRRSNGELLVQIEQFNTPFMTLTLSVDSAKWLRDELTKAIGEGLSEGEAQK